MLTPCDEAEWERTWLPGAVGLKLEFQQPAETHTVGKMHWRQFVPEIHYVPKHIKILLFISKLLSER